MRKIFYRISFIVIFCAAFAGFGFSQKRAAKTRGNLRKTVVAPPKIQISTFEKQVFDELNTARRNPSEYVNYLEARRGAMHGKTLKMPNQIALQTIEGEPAIDEAVAALKKTSGLRNFSISEGLTAVARAQLADLLENPELGHFGKDGSDLKTRIARFGSMSGKCGENICFGGNSAREVTAIFLIDDGVPERGHRKAVLNFNFSNVGIACGTGKKKQSICVVVFADQFKNKTNTPDAVEF